MVNPDIKALRDQLAQIIADNKKKDSENKNLNTIIENLTHTLEKTTLTIAELQRKLAYYENSNSPPSARSLEYRAQKTKKRNAKNNSNKNNNNKSKGRKIGHKGESHDRKADKTVHNKTDKCDKCNGNNITHEKINSKLLTEISKPVVTITNSINYKSTCNDCGHTHKPKNSIDGTSLGPRFTTEIVCLWYKKTSIRDITEFVNDKYDLELCSATIQHALDAASKKLEPEYDQIKHDVQDKNLCKYIDETTIPINGKNGFVWVVMTKHGCCFLASTSRAAVVLELNFPHLDGPVIADGYIIYRIFEFLQRCWAHILREAKFQAEKGICISQYAKLAELFEYAKNLKGDVRAAKMRSVLEEQADAIAQEYVDNDVKFGTTLRNAVPNLYTFLFYPDMDPTNNRAERALRNPVIHRKIRGQLVTQGGMKMFGILLSCMYTWKIRGKNVSEQLLAALEVT